MEVKTLNDIELDNLGLVLLDLDDTLYSYAISHQAALAAVSDWLRENRAVAYDDFQTNYQRARKKVHDMHKQTAAGHSRFFYFQFMLEHIFGKTDFEATTVCDELYWSTFIENMVLYDDALHFLELCKAKNIDICIVTDLLASVQFAKIKHLAIGKYIRYIVSSEEVGVEKPNPLLFLYAIEKSGGPPVNGKHIAVIGDNPKKDIFDSKLYAVKQYLICR